MDLRQKPDLASVLLKWGDDSELVPVGARFLAASSFLGRPEAFFESDPQWLEVG
jgi:hypothetical protein